MNQIKRHKIKIILIIMVLVGVVFYQQITTRAVFDETKAVNYKKFTSNHQIDNSTLFVGTYLINLQALSDELYKKAIESAEESGQSNLYYKSEISGGTWHEITSAEGIKNISDEDPIVKEDELADLFVTYYVGADGVVKSAIDDSKISIFNVPDPYDLLNLPELEQIKMQYENGLITEGKTKDDLTGVAKFYYNNITTFFNMNLRDSETDECDKQLKALNTCYEQLRSQDKIEEAEILYTLMSRIDAKRRAIIFSKLSEIEGHEISKLQTNIGEDKYDKADYDDIEFIKNTEVESAIGESLASCQQSYIKYSGKQLSEGKSILGYAEYEKSMDVLDISELGYSESLSKSLKELKCIYNIENSKVGDKEGELEILNNELISKADQKYEKAYTAGESGTYLAAKASGMSLAASKQILEDDKSELSSICSELQFLIKAKTTRLDSNGALDYTNERLDLADGFSDKVPFDDFQVKANETIQEHIIWLKALAKEITDSDKSLTSTMTSLENDKAELLIEKNNALDNNDLAGAEKLDAKIAAVDKNIEKQENELLSKLGESGNSLSDVTEAQNSLGNKSTANNINQLNNTALSALMDGDISKLSQAAYGLAALGAEDSLNELLQKCTDSNAKDILEAAKEESLNSELHDQYGKNDGSSVGNKAMSSDDLLNLLNDLLGESFENLDAEGQIIVTCAVNLLGQSGVNAGTDLAKQLINKCVSDKNRYAYKIPEGQAEQEYLALATIAKATGYRYVYSDSLKEATLTYRGKSYVFTVGTVEAVLPDKSTEQMTDAMLFKAAPYLIESAGIKYFDCQAEYVESTGYSACMTSDMMEKAQELLQEIQDSMEE